MEARTFEGEYCILKTLYTQMTVLSSFNVLPYKLIAPERLENVTTDISPDFREVIVSDLVNYWGGFQQEFNRLNGG